MPEVNSYRKGDLLVKINVFIPKDISRDETKQIEKLRESESFKANDNGEQGFFSRMKNMFE